MATCPHSSKWARTSVALDASRSILNASSGEHWFCAMTAPAARPITVRDSRAAERSSRASWSLAILMASRSDVKTCPTKASNLARSSGPKADGSGGIESQRAEGTVFQAHRDNENATESAGAPACA